MKQTPKTLEEIRQLRAAVAVDLKHQEARIRKTWANVVTPPPVGDDITLWANRASAAYSMFDGFRTGYKLLRALGFVSRLRRKKK